MRLFRKIGRDLIRERVEGLGLLMGEMLFYYEEERGKERCE